MNIHMAVLAAALYLGADGETGLHGPEQAQLSQICNLRVSDPTIELKGTPLTLRLSAYAATELVGPTPCEKVRIFVSDREVSRHLWGLRAKHENNKEYVTYYRVTVDGSASFDPALNGVRLDISGMGCLTRVKHVETSE